MSNISWLLFIWGLGVVVMEEMGMLEYVELLHEGRVGVD